MSGNGKRTGTRWSVAVPLEWRHNERVGVSNRRRLDCLLNRLFRRRSKKLSKLRVTGLCEGNSPGTGEFPAQRASNAENVSIWWRHQVLNELQWLEFEWMVDSKLLARYDLRIDITYVRSEVKIA